MKIAMDEAEARKRLESIMVVMNDPEAWAKVPAPARKAIALTVAEIRKRYPWMVEVVYSRSDVVAWLGQRKAKTR